MPSGCRSGGNDASAGHECLAAEKYTYTVTISAGNKGVIQDAGVELVSSTASKYIQDGKLVYGSFL